MILRKINGALHVCDIEPQPVCLVLSKANVTRESELTRIESYNSKVLRAANRWDERFASCKKWITLPEHEKTFSQFANTEIFDQKQFILTNVAWYGYPSDRREIAVPVSKIPEFV